MNILFISISAPPKSGAESLQVAKYLKYLSKASTITLVTTPASRIGWKKKDDAQFHFLDNISKVIELTSINSFDRWKGFISRKLFTPWLNKPDTDFLFHWQRNKVFTRLDDTPDIIYSRSTPFSSSVLALKVKMKLNKPWLMHMSDPWSDSPYGNYSNRYNKISEEKCFSTADAVSFTTPETLAYYSIAYPQFREKFFIAPNVFDKEEVVDLPEIFTGQKLTLLHSGNLYRQRDIKPLLNALKQLDGDQLNTIEVQLAGNMDEHNLDLIKESSLNCFTLLGSLPASESYRYQRKADVLISIDKPIEQEIDKVFLPSKIQDYIAARKIILAITGRGSATYNTVQDCFGYCFEHDDSGNIADFLRGALKAYHSGDKDFFIMKEPGDRFEASFNAARLSDQFNKLILQQKK